MPELLRETRAELDRCQSLADEMQARYENLLRDWPPLKKKVEDLGNDCQALEGLARKVQDL